MSELRNALAIARDDFFASLSGATLDGAPSGKYLRNRLELAFVSGWDAHEKRTPPASPDSKPTGEDVRDAERYRWLRDSNSNLAYCAVSTAFGIGIMRGDEMDRVVDATIARQRAGGAE